MKKRILFEAVLAIVAILLFFLMYLMIASSSPEVAVQWEASCNDTAYYTLSDDSGNLYAFMGSYIYAIDKNGYVKWSVSVPDDYWIGSSLIKPAAACDDGMLYVYMRPNMTKICEDRGLAYKFGGESSAGVFTDDMNRRVMDEYAGNPLAYTFNESLVAISSDGRTAWTLSMHSLLYDPDVQARNGRVYVYHDYNETVLDRNGHVLWNIENVGTAPAVDERGNAYLVRGVPANANSASDRRYPGTTAEAYDAAGERIWSYQANESLNVQNIGGVQSSVPIYDNHTLYLPLNNGVTALGTDGSLLWTKRFDGSIHIFKLMPFDPEGNLYVRVYPGMAPWDLYNAFDPARTPYDRLGWDDPHNGSYIAVVGPDGSEVAPRIKDPAMSNDLNLATDEGGIVYNYASDGIVYSISDVMAGDNRTMGDLDTAILTAYDLKDNLSKLWSYKFPAGEQGTAVINATNFKYLLDPQAVRNAIVMNSISHGAWSGGMAWGISGSNDVRLVFGRDVTYVGFWTCNYEYPAIFGYSNCTYAGGLYAFDRNGDVLWSEPADSLLTSMLAKDGTIYYSTRDGSIQAARTDLAAGIAISAALYVFIRFFVIGAAARARSKLDSNANRNGVFKFISEHPGSTLYEISRGTSLNIGTARYHLFILGINHRVAVQKTGQKFVRYFPNSGTYSRDEQMLMSLMRREALRRVLEKLMETPGLSNSELSRQLDLPESAMSKYMKELHSKGIISKEQASGGRLAYAIKAEYIEKVAFALQHVSN